MALRHSLAALLLASLAFAYTDPSSCTASNKFYDPVLLECTSCPTDTARASDFAFCNCSTSTYPNPDVIGFKASSACLPLSGSYSPATDVASVYAVDGSLAPTPTPCVNGYPDAQHLRCIPCGPGTTFSSTFGCQCTGGQYWINGQCYSSTGWTATQSTTADILGEQQAQVGCKQNGIIQSCSFLLNQCAAASYSNSSFYCQFLKNQLTTTTPANGLPTYSFSGKIADSLAIYASSVPGINTTLTKSTLNFLLVEYNADGSINDVKPIDNSIFSCTLSAQDIVDLQSFAGQFTRTCTTLKNFTTTYFYDIYVQNADGSFAEVPISVAGGYYKRFTPKNYRGFEIKMITDPPLQVPLVVLSSSSTVSSSALTSDTSLNYSAFLAVFMVGTMLIFIVNFYRYMKYNPDENNDPYYCFKAIFLFFMYVIKYVAVGLHLFLLCFSGYVFCFYKFQHTLYLSLLDLLNDTTGVYQTFFSIFYADFSILFVAVLIQIFNLTNTTDYFLIDWEKEKELGKFEMGRNRKEVSIWRKVLLVNELYELSVSRVINIELVSLFSLMFLAGLDWINFSQLVPNTTYNLNNANGYTTSFILAYFLIAFLIIAIAVIQFLLRHAIKIWWPLPIEDFIDLCSVSNISIIIFDEALHGYYIHGMNPLGQSEGSLAYIESMFEKEAKAFGKSRSFKLDDVDQCQTFEVVFPFQIRQAFQVKYKSRFNQKLAGKAYNTSFISNPIPEMLNEEDYKDLQEITNTMLQSFKYYLQGVKTSMLNVRERSFFQKLISCPLDTLTMGKLPVFFKDPWYEFSNVLLSGHEFLLLFNFINFVVIFYIATNNIYYAFFIAFIFEKIIFFLCSFFIRRNISRNTLIDDKFFA